MLKEGKFGIQEAVCLTTITICNKLFFTSPGYLSRFVGGAGWYTTMISSLTAILAFSIILILFYLYPGKNIIEIFELTLGRFIGTLFSLLFTAYFLFSAGTLLREFLDIFKIYVMPETPISVLSLCMIATIVISAFMGLESIARTAKIFGPFILICLLAVLLMCTQNYKTENIYPLLGYGIGNTIKYGVLRCSVYDEVMILTVFAGALQGTKYIKKAGYISLIISGLLGGIIILCFSLSFPVHILQELTAPFFVMTRTINFGAFFQRLEPLFVFIWMFATLINTTTLFYCSGSCFVKTCRIEDIRPVLFPLSVFLYLIIMAPKDFLSIVEGNVQLLRLYGWVIMFLLPIIALIVAGIRRACEKMDTNQSE